ncbi:MAG: hypothetical protein AAB601_03045 [Patescibacteria group bacterium]
MKTTMRYLVATVGIIGAILLIMYGSYLPIVRSRSYITAIRALQNIRSFTEFKRVYERPLDFPIPLGDEEVAKFAAYDVLGIIQNPNHPEEVVRNLVLFIEPFMVKTNLRHNLALGQMYETLLRNYQKEEYYRAAEGYYRAAVEIGPQVPPPLFSLMNLYLNAGEEAKANEVAERILEYWPDALKRAPQQENS